MKSAPRPFKLERYFGEHEFSARVLLSNSDVESLKMSELLEVGAQDDAAMALWQNLSLGYTESAGLPQLLDAVAATYSDDVQAEHVVEAVPAEGILLAMQALVEPGDRVIVAWPAYQSLYEIAASRGASLTRWSASAGPGPPSFDVAELEALVRLAQPKLIIVNFPHNPTGAQLTAQEWERLVGVARAAGAWLFSDEMYRGLEHGDAPPNSSACELYERAVTLSGMSKAYALPGLRVGWLACRDAGFVAKVRELKDYTTICGSAPSEVLALIALRQRETVLARSKDIMAEGLAALSTFCDKHADKLEFHQPTAGPVAYLRMRGDGLTADDAQAYSEELVRSTGVMVVTSHSFEAAGAFLRLGFAKRGFASALAAWEETFEWVRMPRVPGERAGKRPRSSR